MAETECAAVAALIQELAIALGGKTVPKLDAARLAAIAFGSAPLVDSTVAVRGNSIVGACLALLTYSTWRGETGLYVVDLFVSTKERGRGIGENLLRTSARRGQARGATFIKLEVDDTNTAATRFYGRLGFARNDHDRTFALESDNLARFAAET